MLKVQVSIPELKSHALAIRKMAMDPMTTLQSLAGDLRGRFEEWMNELMQAELSLHVGRERYERTGSRSNHRNGFRSRQITVKNLGTLELQMPRDREGSFKSAVVPERIQVDPRIEQDPQMLFLGGASTRTVELMSERLFGRRLSAGEVSKANKKLLAPVEAWRNRSLADEKFLYLFLDGTNFCMRRGNEVVKHCCLWCAQYLITRCESLQNGSLLSRRLSTRPAPNPATTQEKAPHGRRRRDRPLDVGPKQRGGGLGRIKGSIRSLQGRHRGRDRAAPRLRAG